ncbi:MAG TPA: PilZ domain-containing protein [Chitinispirillaceae bacterium]|nr:PilZ domain-containing protein [Chitinispirillaceae bacterium]
MFAQNRRMYTRYSFTIAITLFQNDTAIHCSECRNISHGGMCVILDENISLNGIVTVVLSKMIGKNMVDLKADCRVAWQDNQGSYDNGKMLGLEFISIDNENGYNLEKILAYSSASPQEVF